jgi:hypothetical protein
MATLLLLLLPGCIGETAVPTVAQPYAGLAHGPPGTLRLDGNCLRVDIARSFLVVWPHGASVDYGSDPPIVQDGRGGSARVGDLVTLTGGETDSGSLALSRKSAGIVRRCGGPIFATNGFLKG